MKIESRHVETNFYLVILLKINMNQLDCLHQLILFFRWLLKKYFREFKAEQSYMYIRNINNFYKISNDLED